MLFCDFELIQIEELEDWVSIFKVSLAGLPDHQLIFIKIAETPVMREFHGFYLLKSLHAVDLQDAIIRVWTHIHATTRMTNEQQQYILFGTILSIGDVRKLRLLFY